MLSILRRLLADKRAVTSIEYALIVCLIATAAIAGMTTLGRNVLNMLGPAANALT
ncbi:MAG: Flp family type IVb pilin [Alphaproteobacteria bacterium]|nr:Flp family type IVb pilin [Alphaproteobacteria bacterium]